MKRIRPSQNRTHAYKRFLINIRHTKEIMEAGLFGITKEVDRARKILSKFNHFKGVPGPVAKDYEPVMRSTFDKKSKVFQLTYDRRTTVFIRNVLRDSLKDQKNLRFHLFSILTVAIWGAFETYTFMLFKELFLKKPEILKSTKTVTFEDVIENKDNVLKYVIDKQLEIIGHFTFDELVNYLDKRINFKFEDSELEQLKDFYLIRNIIAHNSGIVRSNLLEKIPNSININNDEIRITKSYTENMTDSIEKAVYRIEDHVIKKFWKV